MQFNLTRVGPAALLLSIMLAASIVHADTSAEMAVEEFRQVAQNMLQSTDAKLVGASRSPKVFDKSGSHVGYLLKSGTVERTVDRSSKSVTLLFPSRHNALTIVQGRFERGDTLVTTRAVSTDEPLPGVRVSLPATGLVLFSPMLPMKADHQKVYVDIDDDWEIWAQIDSIEAELSGFFDLYDSYDLGADTASNAEKEACIKAASATAQAWARACGAAGHPTVIRTCLVAAEAWMLAQVAICAAM